MRVLHAEKITKIKHRSRLDDLDPRCRVFGAMTLAAAIAFIDSFAVLPLALPIPLALALSGDGKRLLRSLFRVNLGGLLVCVLLPLTYPGDEIFGMFSRSGLFLALLILCKLNLISLLMLTMVVPLDVGEIDNALRRFGVSEKFRILLLLTIRQIFILKDRIVILSRALRLRSGGAGGITGLLAYANMLGTTMIHASDRAERSTMAMRSRGGFRGFRQCEDMAWRYTDTIVSLICAIAGVAIIVRTFGG